MTVPAQQAETTEGRGSLARLALLSLVVGGLAGVVGALFRVALERADGWRGALVAWAHGAAFPGLFCVIAACAAAAALAAFLVRRFSPHASGSGIPHVEAVLRGEAPPAPFVLLPVKFLGGGLAIGSGLALGREGPSVQMGAVIGHLVGDAFGLGWPDCRVLLAAGAGAGLATSFNAPMAGAIFVLEELVQKFEQRIAIAALASSATAIAVAHLILGDAPDFDVAGLRFSPAAGPLFFIFGGLAGLLAIAYNHVILAAIARAESRKLPVEIRAGLIGASVGMFAWFAPGAVGGGDALTQRALDGADSLVLVTLLFAFRFAFGAASYSAGTPGGLFAPLLTLGAQSGLLFGAACAKLFPFLDIAPPAFAVVGMAAFFTGVVRAPLTGIVLVTEMTANVALLPPMLAACFSAMLVPAILDQAPIYDSLRERSLRAWRERDSG